LKKINIIGNIRSYLISKNNGDLQKIGWLFDTDLEALVMNMDMKMVINDRMHYCVRLNLKNKRDNEPNGERKERH
jgi:hypothetical protein